MTVDINDADDRIRLNSSWKNVLASEFAKPYMQTLRDFLVAESRRGKMIFPRGDEIFAALNLTPFENVRVVIIGQDPYHGVGQAHGLSFSVRPGVPIPPSLHNIYRELALDVGLKPPNHGALNSWAEQGVLLLNAVLTVEKDRAASHQNRGWENFTDAIIEHLNEKREHLVFLLWGTYAQRKGQRIDGQRHLVLQAPHPSPLSAHRGFIGSRHFSRSNAYLRQHGLPEIDWCPVLPTNPVQPT